MSFEEFAGSSDFSQGTSLSELEVSQLESSGACPRIFLMGARRSGKSSIQKVVFHKMSPHETLFLESTHDVRCRRIDHSPLVQFSTLDFPGGFECQDSTQSTSLFSQCDALVFVIDAQEMPYEESVEYIAKMAKLAFSINPKILFELFVHKVDGDSYMSDEKKIDVLREIQTQLSDELADSQPLVPISFYLTSIYDHSIFEAFSKVIQKLIPHLPFLENLMDCLITKCQIEKAFLFDVHSKLYVSTDSSPVDTYTYELCSDMIDVVVDVSGIYSGPMKEAEPSVSSRPTDSCSSSTIRLENGAVLHLREVTRSLALVCMMKSESFLNPGLLEHNFVVFKDIMNKLFRSSSFSLGRYR
eukprot:194100_1